MPETPENIQYSQKVLEHFSHPHNVGEIADANGVGNVGNPICVLPYTLIQANSEITPIVQINRSDRVLSHDGKYHRIKKLISRPYTGKIYRIWVNNLGTTYATPEHHILALKLGNRDKFATFRKFKPDWYCAQELKEGNVILYPILREIQDVRSIEFDIERPKWDFKSKDLPTQIRVDENFLRLVGYYLAEGYTRLDPCKGTLGFVFNVREKQYIDDVMDIISKIFNIKSAGLVPQHSGTAIDIVFYSARLARFFARYFGKGALEKHIPHWMILLPIDKQRSILEGAWRGDGYISRKQQRAKYVTISKQFAFQMRTLLQRQEIISSFSIGKAYDIHKESYLLYIQDDASLKKIADIMGVDLDIKPRKRNNQKTWFADNFYFTTIREIEAVDYSGLVYNLEMEEPHSYVSDSLVLHNCGDVMRLYIKVQDGKIVDAKFKTFGCLPPDERIVVSQGGWKEISDIPKGSELINSEGERTKIVETYTRYYSGKMLRVVPFISPFNSFRVTPEHPVLCLKRQWIKGARRSSSKCDWLRISEKNLLSTTPDFVQASHLEKSDYLVFNVNKEVKDNPLFTVDTMRLLGYYLSEGYIVSSGNTVAFAFNKNEKPLIEETQRLLLKISGKVPKTRIRGNVAEIYICSRKLVGFFTAHCQKIASKKSLSEEVLLLPFPKQWEMIETYLKGDGDSYERRPKNSKTYRIVTVSGNLAIQVQEILARGGIFASIRQVVKRDCYIGNRKLKDSLQYVISFKLNRAHKFARYNNEYFLIPIRQISGEDFTGRVYNFQVCGHPNSYLVKGFAVHNCGAAIATSSMVTDLVKGKTIDEALQISNKAVAEALGGLPRIKMHCSVLAEEALRAAIEDYKKRQEDDSKNKD